MKLGGARDHGHWPIEVVSLEERLPIARSLMERTQRS
jgi:hypothetical protein